MKTNKEDRILRTDKAEFNRYSFHDYLWPISIIFYPSDGWSAAHTIDVGRRQVKGNQKQLEPHDENNDHKQETPAFANNKKKASKVMDDNENLSPPPLTNNRDSSSRSSKRLTVLNHFSSAKNTELIKDKKNLQDIEIANNAESLQKNKNQIQWPEL